MSDEFKDYDNSIIFSFCRKWKIWDNKNILLNNYEIN